MNKPFLEIDGENFTISAFETKPIEGYEAPTNKKTGEQLPNCCPFHKSVFERAVIFLAKFPNCCEEHKKFVGKWWFRKENYNGIAEKIVKQLSYTEHHISERIKKNDWYKDITDYIEYNVASFGHPAVGLNLYLGYVKHYIQSTKSKLNKEQRQRLAEFIEGYYKPSETEKTDFNILYSTYQQWLKEFPFELNSYFGNLKQHFEKQLPILNGKPETNIYSGMSKAKMHTKSSLIEALINLTNNLLTHINGVTLYEKGLITDANKIKLELVINSRKLKLKQGYKNSSPNEEHRYRNILKEWFKEEKIFIDEITPLLKALPPQQTETKTEPEQPTFTNNFDKITPTEIYKHFKAGLVEKQYLTEQELNEYLKAAFELKKIPETLFKIKDAPNKATIEAIFYKYYKNVAGKIHGTQYQYAALLGDYFEGYKTTTVSSNFSKSVY